MDPERLKMNRCNSVAQVASGGFNLAIRCKQCGYARVVPPEPLWRLCVVRGWSDSLIGLRKHLRCSNCQERYPEVQVTTDKPDGNVVGVTELEARRMAKRLRD